MRYTVIGLGQFGQELCTELSARNIEVVAVASTDEELEQIKDLVTYAVVTDYTNPAALRELELDDQSAVIVAIGDSFEENLLVVTHLQKMGVRYIYARVMSPVHEHILSQMNVYALINLSRVASKQLASQLESPEFLRVSPMDENHSIVATMLKMMKEAYIPDFEGWKKEVMERKTAVWSKEFNARWESFLKERDERVERKKKELSIPFEQRMRRQKTEEERIRDREFGEKDAAFMQEAREKWDKCRNLANILSIMEDRNSKIKSFLKDGGGGLLRILLDNYPGKATEVFKYLKLAGYEEGEMMELVDREEGKTEETEFLYQSPLGRKFLKEKKQKK